jgi:hypothetical protein
MHPSEQLPERWYIIKRPSARCDVLLQSAVVSDSPEPEPVPVPEPEIDIDIDIDLGTDLAQVKRWGPFASRDEAIARRVGLIRAGHCQPI